MSSLPRFLFLYGPCLFGGVLLLSACPTTTATEPEPLGTEVLEVAVDGGEAWVDLREGSVRFEAPSEGERWDLHVSGWNLYLNGGASGPGNASGIPFRDLDPDLQFEEVNREQDLLYFLFQDDYGSQLCTWWAYGLRSDHNLYSRFHRYWLSDEGRFWVVQIVGYYQLVDGAPEAGWVSFRWREVISAGGPSTQTLTVDATAGGFGVAADHPENHFQYVNLETGEVLAHDDEQAADALDWHIGFRRFYVRLNGGTSGSRGIAAFDEDALVPETNEQLLGLDPDSTLANFEGLVWEDQPESEQFAVDQVTPILLGWIEGTPGVNATANPIPFLVSTADDAQRAKIRVVSLVDGTIDGPQAITLEYALLP